jgi:hypothetical protein
MHGDDEGNLAFEHGLKRFEVEPAERVVAAAVLLPCRPVLCKVARIGERFTQFHESRSARSTGHG